MLDGSTWSQQSQGATPLPNSAVLREAVWKYYAEQIKCNNEEFGLGYQAGLDGLYDT